MIKSIDRCGRASVTFTLPAAVRATRVAICGEWNGWSAGRDVMDRVGDVFSLTIELQPGRAYRFRYLLDGERWENDWDADAYVPNAFGTDDSVVDLTALATLVPTAGPETGRGSNIEREAKLVAPPGLAIPDLNGLVLGATARVLPVERLDATYYDTADLRLARSGITVRHRGGESGPPWTVKLPEDDRASDLVRREIRFEGPVDQVPDAAADLVLASTRALPLEPVASLTTVRRPVEIRGVDGELLAEVVDDTVSVSHNQNPTGWFREVEVELHISGDKGDRVLEAAVSRLIGAGCGAEPPLPKLVRALGEPATRPADVVVPPMPPRATVVDLVRHAAAGAVAQILHHDPGARLGDDPEDVHKLRVAARRLRSDLHSFAAVLDPARTETIRSELGWLGGVVGVVRDTDVLSARLATRLAALPEPDAAGVHRLQVLLERQAVDTRTAMLIALRSARYLHLLDTLVDLAAAPPFRKAAGKLTPRTSQRLASKIVQKPWRRVAYAVESLGPDPSDAQLHQVRILAKRSRYAAEAAAPLLRPAATRFAAAVADLQTVLGDHQDTVLAEAWLRNAVVGHPEAVATVQQLIALEQERRQALRAQWPAIWRKANARKLHTWV
ncbi:MAG: CHAD domain-containing protein [Acidimicrobiales bacterium]|jgi:CHAD domain-containing protein